MADWRRFFRLLWLLWAIFLVFWAGGIGSHIISGGTPQEMSWAAPLFLFLAAAIALASEPQEWKPMLMAAVIGFIAETIGVRTAYPFGAYEYTPVLAPSLFGVPLVVAGAWMVLAAYVRQMRAGIVGSAAWMAALDLVIDPLAANDLGYWHWRGGGPYYGVPVLNFIGWFAVGLLIFAVLRRQAPRNDSIRFLGSAILLFFAAIAAVHHFFFVAVLGGSLAAVGYFKSMPSKVSTTI